jgi:hypothetical protein
MVGKSWIVTESGDPTSKIIRRDLTPSVKADREAQKLAEVWKYLGRIAIKKTGCTNELLNRRSSQVGEVGP